MTPRCILVTDGEERSALALVRSFGRAGHRIVVGAARARSLAAASRYTEAEVLLPSPLQDAAGFVEAVLNATAKNGCDTLIPVSEPSLYAILGARSRFAHLLLPFPDGETFRRLSDKAEVLKIAPSFGFAVPKQVTIVGPSEGAAAIEGLKFPVVLKPSRSVTECGAGRIRLGVTHASDADALNVQLATLPIVSFPVLVQERVEGPGIGVFLLLWNGTLRAAFAHRRIREKPPSGGVSVYRESVVLDEQLLARCVALLQSFSWRGVAMIELKVDQRTGTPYLMEVNGRFWGSLQLAIDAGVDFPNLLLLAATDMPTPPMTGYRAGIRSRWWWGDVDHLISMFRRSRSQLHLPPSAPGRLRSLAAFLRLWWPGDRNEVWRWQDPKPLGRETVNWFRETFHRD